MIKILFIFFLGIIRCQNFSYSDDDWFILTSPDHINSITYNDDEILVSSINGIFSYNRFDNEFYYRNDLLKRLDDKNIKIIHYDSFKEHIWLINRDAMYFKSSISDFWREIDFYSDLNISNSNMILNIGSNPTGIFIETYNQILLLDGYNGNLIKVYPDKILLDEYVYWSGTMSGNYNDPVDLMDYFFISEWDIVNNSILQYKGRDVEVTCLKKIDNSSIIIGTDSGEMFRCNIHSKKIKKIKSVPPITNMHVVYLDNKNQWWIADNDFHDLNRTYYYDREIIFLARWNEGNNKWVEYYQNKYPYIASRDINCIYRLEDFLYIGTGHGLLVFNLVSNTWNLYNSEDGFYDENIVRIIHHDDILYLATSKGIILFSHIINQPISTKYKFLSNYKINDILVDSNNLYIASERGFYGLDLKTDIYNLISNRELYELELFGNHLFASTENQIFKLEKDKMKSIFNINYIENFKVFGDYIWINNTNAVNVYNYVNNVEYEYDSSDGISGNIIYDLNLDADWIWFITNNGISFYNWKKFHNNGF